MYTQTLTATDNKKVEHLPGFYKGTFYGQPVFYALLKDNQGIIQVSTQDHRFASVAVSVKVQLNPMDCLSEPITEDEFKAAYQEAQLKIEDAAGSAFEILRPALRVYEPVNN